MFHGPGMSRQVNGSRDTFPTCQNTSDYFKVLKPLRYIYIYKGTRDKVQKIITKRKFRDPTLLCAVPPKRREEGKEGRGGEGGRGKEGGREKGGEGGREVREGGKGGEKRGGRERRGGREGKGEEEEEEEEEKRKGGCGEVDE